VPAPLPPELSPEERAARLRGQRARAARAWRARNPGKVARANRLAAACRRLVASSLRGETRAR
jgi:hypothetical protein